MNNKKIIITITSAKILLITYNLQLTTYNSRQSQGLFDIYQKRLATLFGAANHY